MVTINQEGYKFTKIKVIIIQPTTSPSAEYTLWISIYQLSWYRLHISVHDYSAFYFSGALPLQSCSQGYCIPPRHNSLKPFEKSATWEDDERNCGNEARDNEILARQV